MIKGVVISLGTTTKMTTNYRLILADLSLYASTKGHKKWSGTIGNKTSPENKIWEVIASDSLEQNNIQPSRLKSSGLVLR